MTQLDSVNETIDGKEFEVFKLDPMESLGALNVVKEVVAPALGAALGSIESLGDVARLLDDPESGGKLGTAVEKLLMSADFERQQKVIATFRTKTKVDGKPLEPQFPLVFRGDLPLMFKWLKLCFRAEWGNVGRAIASGISGAVAQTESEQKSQNTSPTAGQSTT